MATAAPLGAVPATLVIEPQYNVLGPITETGFEIYPFGRTLRVLLPLPDDLPATVDAAMDGAGFKPLVVRANAALGTKAQAAARRRAGGVAPTGAAVLPGSARWGRGMHTLAVRLNGELAATFQLRVG